MPPMIFLHGTQNSMQRYPYKPAIWHYRQIYPARAAFLRVEAFDYFTFSVLQITGIHASEVEIQSIHTDYAVPIFSGRRDAGNRKAQPQYPLRLARNSSISLLLSISSGRDARINSLFPRKIIIGAKQSSIIFEAEW